MAKRIWIWIGMVALLAGCYTGKRALEQGNYYQAVMQSIDRLQQNGDSKKARNTLKQAYPLAVNYYTEEIRRADGSTDPFKYEAIMDHYNTLNAMYNGLRRCPACTKLVNNPRDYSRQYEAVRKQAAQARYEAGMAMMDPNDRLSSREAFLNFERAEELQPGYRDVRQKLNEAFDYATLKVLLDVATVPSPRYSVSSQFFANQIYGYTHDGNINRFVRFYSPEEAKRLGLKQADQVISMQFEDFVVGETHTVREVETVSRDSVNTGTVKVNGETVPVYSTVEAKITRFTRSVVSRGILDVRIFDATSRRVLAQEKFNGEFVWNSRWANFQGDQRALSDLDVRLCGQEPSIPPPPQDMFVEFTRPIYNQAVGYLRRYYSRY